MTPTAAYIRQLVQTLIWALAQVIYLTMGIIVALFVGAPQPSLAVFTIGMFAGMAGLGLNAFHLARLRAEINGPLW